MLNSVVTLFCYLILPKYANQSQLSSHCILQNTRYMNGNSSQNRESISQVVCVVSNISAGQSDSTRNYDITLEWLNGKNFAIQPFQMLFLRQNKIIQKYTCFQHCQLFQLTESMGKSCFRSINVTILCEHHYSCSERYVRYQSTYSLSRKLS